jgi:ribosomal subunit interface protein
MIKHIDISSTQKSLKIDPKLVKYIEKKFGKLDSYMKRRNREGVRVDVKLRESSGKDGKKCHVEAFLHIPSAGVKLAAEESTINMFAAADIVERKLKNQLKKHKEKSNPDNDRRRNSRARRAIRKFFSR